MKLLTKEQVAEQLQMHPKTLEKKLRFNTIALRFYQNGRTIGFRPQDVEQFIELRIVERDGSGQEPKRIKTKRKITFMTDTEAQKFFKGVDLIDGALECDPDQD